MITIIPTNQPRLPARQHRPRITLTVIQVWRIVAHSRPFSQMTDTCIDGACDEWAGRSCGTGKFGPWIHKRYEIQAAAEGFHIHWLAPCFFLSPRLSRYDTCASTALYHQAKYGVCAFAGSLGWICDFILGVSITGIERESGVWL